MKAAAQLQLFAEPKEAKWYDAKVWTYVTGLPNLSAPMACYVVMIRAPWDPERRSREVRIEALGNVAAAVEWQTWRKATAEEWCERIVAHLQDGEPRTLNRIGVELVDATADIVGDTADAGLWLAVERGLLWYTPQAPVHFIAEKFVKRNG